MQIKTLKELEDTFLVNNELIVPKCISNTDYQMIQKYIENGGEYDAYDQLLKKEELEKININFNE